MKLYQRILMSIGSAFPAKNRIALYRMAGMKIGEGTQITPGFYVDRPERVEIGKHCFINHFVHLHNVGNKDTSITFGNNVFVAPEVRFICTSHEIASENQRAGKHSYGSSIVENGVWIGAGATILPGVKIARGGNRSWSCCY